VVTAAAAHSAACESSPAAPSPTCHSGRNFFNNAKSLIKIMTINWQQTTRHLYGLTPTAKVPITNHQLTLQTRIPLMILSIKFNS